MATATKDASTIEGTISGPTPIINKDGPFARVVALGATHWGEMRSGATVLAMPALDDVNATRLRDAEALAKAVEAVLRRDADTAERQDLIETADVRRVLMVSDTDVQLCEAWMPRGGTHEGYADWVRFCVAGGPHIEIDRKAPSYAAIVARSAYWGAAPGCSNALRLISEDDWNVLVVETQVLAMAKRSAKIAATAAALPPPYIGDDSLESELLPLGA